MAQSVKEGDLARFLALQMLDMNQDDRVLIMRQTATLFLQELIRAGHPQETAVEYMKELLDGAVEMVRKAHPHDPGSA